MFNEVSHSTPRLAVDNTPMHITTDHTVRRDLQETFRQRTEERLEEVLIDIGHAPDDAKCYASAVARLMDPERFDATVMLVAGELFKADHPKATRRLITEPIGTRGKYLRRAVRAVSLAHGALEGQEEPRMVQAAADWYSHRMAAVECAAVSRG